MRAAFGFFRLFFCLPTLLMGCVLLVMTGIQVKNRSEWVRGEGVIQSITTHRDSDGDVSHMVMVQYQTEDGDSYTENLHYYQSGYHEGLKVNICYDPENPSKVTSGDRGPELLTGIMGFACLLEAAVAWGVIGYVRKKAIAAQQNGYIQ